MVLLRHFDADARLLGGYAIVGGQIPLATGAALAISYRGGIQAGVRPTAWASARFEMHRYGLCNRFRWRCPCGADYVVGMVKLTLKWLEACRQRSPTTIDRVLALLGWRLSPKARSEHRPNSNAPAGNGGVRCPGPAGKAEVGRDGV
jgi:hypothetical protein